MSRKPESYWMKHINEWEKSGLTITAYAKNNGIVQSTLSKRIKKCKQSLKAIKVPLKSVNYQSSGTDIYIESRTMKIKLSSTISLSVLQLVLRELR